MLKKNSWIAALLLAVAFVFTGCLDPLEEEDNSGKQDIVIVDLARAIAGKSGVVGPDFNEINDGKEGFFTRAGDACVMTITGEGLIVDPSNPSINWGAGLDLSNAGIKFQAGDKIYIKGVATEAGKILLNMNHSGWDPLGGWNPDLAAGATFEQTFTLTAGDVGAIKGTNPQAFRIRRADPTGGKFLITQLTVSGKRDDDFVLGPGGAKEAKPLCKCSSFLNCPCKTNPSKDCGTEFVAGSGIYECPECTPKNLVTVPTGSGTYTAPADTATEFYVDLNPANIGKATDGKIINVDVAYTDATNVKVEANKVTYTFEKDNQPLAFKLSTSALAAVKEALLANLYVDVEITAKVTGAPYTETTLGKDDTSPYAKIRYGFCNPTTGNSWNGVNLIDNALVYTDKVTGRLTKHSNLTASGDGNKTVDAFIIQLRGGNRKTAIEITSIKIKMPATVPVDITALPVDAPAAGIPAKTSFETTQFTGAITWSPTIAGGGVFDVNKQYTAKVVLTAKKYFTFKGAPGSYTIGNITGIINTFTGGASNLQPNIDFTFPATLDQHTFPTDSSVKPQTGTPLADLGADGAKVGVELTATYAQGTGGTAVAEANVTFVWQKETSTVGVYADVGTGKKYTPTSLGSFRIVLTAEDYVNKPSTAFTVYSPAQKGELDAALNATFTPTADATSKFTLSSWVVSNTSVGMPFTVSGGGTKTVVANGINITGRSNDYDCVTLKIKGTWSLIDGGTVGDGAGSIGSSFDISANKYKITFYGFIIGEPPTGTKAVIQGNSDGWSTYADSAAMTAIDGSFKLTWEIPANLPAGLEQIRLATNNTVSYRISLVVIEDLGPRE
jgi:hypothetical protein